MESIAALVKAHPQGGRLFESLRAAGSWPVDTPGGRFFAEWETQAPVTCEGQLMFFFQFLHAGGRWEEPGELRSDHDAQRRFPAMSPEERKRASLEESRQMADFYARNPDELIPDFDDGDDTGN